jgi:arabinogalactan endo-1,4-beta-galactosidase
VKPTRRQLLTTLAVAATAGGAAALYPVTRDRESPTPGGGALRIRGADLSFLAEQERHGNTFTDLASPDPQRVERILAAHGATHVRFRLWVDPPSGRNTLTEVLTMARRVTATGLGLIISLHLSDTWADPHHQHVPQAWQGQDLATLQVTVRGYTASVVQAFIDNGTPIDLLQVGNEIRHGMLWPVGAVDRDGREEWGPFLALLGAGLDGARQAGDPPELAVHVNSGGNNRQSRQVFDQVRSAGLEYDVIGLSYYPMWNGTFDELSDNVTDLADRYGKDVVALETAYPWTLTDGDGAANRVADADLLPESDRYPPTPEGQRAFYDRLRAVFDDVPAGRGCGFVVWEPAWLPGVGVLEGEGNTYDNQTLFDRRGRALPAIDCFRPIDPAGGAAARAAARAVPRAVPRGISRPPAVPQPRAATAAGSDVRSGARIPRPTPRTPSG